MRREVRVGGREGVEGGRGEREGREGRSEGGRGGGREWREGGEEGGREGVEGSFIWSPTHSLMVSMMTSSDTWSLMVERELLVLMGYWRGTRRTLLR